MISVAKMKFLCNAYLLHHIIKQSKYSGFDSIVLLLRYDGDNDHEMRGPPLRYSVKANAMRPSMAKCPFNISASTDIIAFDLLFLEIPLNMGISKATENRTTLPTNSGTPPLPS